MFSTDQRAWLNSKLYLMSSVLMSLWVLEKGSTHRRKREAHPQDTVGEKRGTWRRGRKVAFLGDSWRPSLVRPLPCETHQPGQPGGLQLRVVTGEGRRSGKERGWSHFMKVRDFPENVHYKHNLKTGTHERIFMPTWFIMGPNWEYQHVHQQENDWYGVWFHL